jgi:hypothetical protein
MSTCCNIDRKSCWLSVAATFVGLNVMEYLVHGVLLRSTYMSVRYLGVWNPEPVMKERMWANLLSYAVVALILPKVFAQGFSADRPRVGQGVRFGLLAGTLLCVTHSLMDFFVYPVSISLAAAWAATGTAEFVIIGVILALLYRPKVQA